MPHIGEEKENVIIDPKDGLDATLQNPQKVESVEIAVMGNTPEQNARRILAQKRKKNIERIVKRRKTRTVEDEPVK